MKNCTNCWLGRVYHVHSFGVRLLQMVAVRLGLLQYAALRTVVMILMLPNYCDFRTVVDYKRKILLVERNPCKPLILIILL